MASTSKRLRMEEYESDDSDCSLGLIEENTGGLDSGVDCELDHLLKNESGISR